MMTALSEAERVASRRAHQADPIPPTDPASVAARIEVALAELGGAAPYLHPYEARYLANLLEGIVNTYVMRRAAGTL